MNAKYTKSTKSAKSAKSTKSPSVPASVTKALNGETMAGFAIASLDAAGSLQSRVRQALSAGPVFLHLLAAEFNTLRKAQRNLPNLKAWTAAQSNMLREATFTHCIRSSKKTGFCVKVYKKDEARSRNAASKSAKSAKSAKPVKPTGENARFADATRADLIAMVLKLESENAKLYTSLETEKAKVLHLESEKAFVLQKNAELAKSAKPASKPASKRA